MSFEVTITELVTTEEMVKGDWGAMSADPKAEYGYRPDRMGRIVRKVDRFKQTVDGLDLVAVIRAVNGITP